MDAIVLARAGLVRLGLADRVTETVDADAVIPAPGQGALAVECRAGDEATRALLAALTIPRPRSRSVRARGHGGGGG